jgi:hypothetical protein
MDRTLHGILLAPAGASIHGPPSNGISSASTSICRVMSFARFCCLGEVGFDPSVLPGCFSGTDSGTVFSCTAGISLSPSLGFV